MHCSACCTVSLSTHPRRHDVSVLISVHHKWCKGMKRWNPLERLPCNLSRCLFCSAIRKVSNAARAAAHVLISAVHSIFCSQCFSDISVQKSTLEVLVSCELSDGADSTLVWSRTPRKIPCWNQCPDKLHCIDVWAAETRSHEFKQEMISVPSTPWLGSVCPHTCAGVSCKTSPTSVLACYDTMVETVSTVWAFCVKA